MVHQVVGLLFIEWANGESRTGKSPNWVSACIASEYIFEKSGQF